MRSKYTKRRTRFGNYEIRRETTFGIQTYHVKEDEFEWAINPKRICKLWDWYHHHGLHRGDPHPMGKCLKKLMREHNQEEADRYKKSGMEVPGCYMTEGVQ